MTVEEIKEVARNNHYETYGLRVDGFAYKAGERANNSHNLYYDPVYDTDGALVYPLIEEMGLYDGGEMEGTSTIKFDPEDEDSILDALAVIEENYRWYYDRDKAYIHMLGSEFESYPGDDMREDVMIDAKVLAGWKA